MNGRCVSFMTSGSALRRIRMWSNARANWSRRRWVLRARFHPRIRLTLDSIRAPRRRRSRNPGSARLRPTQYCCMQARVRINNGRVGLDCAGPKPGAARNRAGAAVGQCGRTGGQWADCRWHRSRGRRAHAPRLSLPAVVGLLNGAVAAVGVDTGLTHIAAALRRPTVELYNFDTSWRTGAYWSPRTVHLGGAGHTPERAEVEQELAHLEHFSVDLPEERARRQYEQ